MEVRRAEVGVQLSACHRLRQRGRTAASEVRARAPTREDAVQEDRQAQLRGEKIRQHERLGAGGAAVGVV